MLSALLLGALVGLLYMLALYFLFTAGSVKKTLPAALVALVVYVAGFHMVKKVVISGRELGAFIAGMIVVAMLTIVRLTKKR